MLLNKTGQSVTLDGQTFTVGMSICGTDASDYEGLYGTILEIRDGDDKETDNEDTDIVCCFEPPLSIWKVKQLEARFYELDSVHRDIGEICLDYVIMGPKMLRAVKSCRIHQIEPIDEVFAFRGFNAVLGKGLTAPPGELYQIVFDGRLGTDDLEEIFFILNQNHPDGYRGRSLTTSDVVELYDETESKFFFCDTFGFKEVPW